LLRWRCIAAEGRLGERRQCDRLRHRRASVPRNLQRGQQPERASHAAAVPHVTVTLENTTSQP
jgi:hypothetical protein